jgi:hypothetical protein
MQDDLFQPTVRALPTTGRRPWRLSSQAYVAFVGGVVAGTAVAYLNSGRLGLAPRERRLVLAAGALGLAVTIPVALVLCRSGSSATVEIPVRILALVAYLVQARFQRPLDRAFQLRDGAHASLWWPGLVAVLAGGLAEVLVLVAAFEVFT